MATLLLLPDEIKLKIFEYLNGVDKIELLKVCQDLHRVGVDRNVLQCLNFANNYKLTLPQLRYISRKLTAPKVTHLNLNGVYWIPSATIRDILIKFTNLTALFILDTQLSFRDLVKTLESTTKVRKLGLSLKPDNCADVFRVKITLPLTHLYVTYNSYSVRALMTLLTQFTELDELWIVEPKRPVKIGIPDVSWMSYVDEPLPKINKKIVCSRQYGSVPGGNVFFDSLKDRKKVWDLAINYYMEDTLFYVFEPSEDPVHCNKKKVKSSFIVTTTKEFLYTKHWSHIIPFINPNVSSDSDQSPDPRVDHLFSNTARIIRKMKCDSSLFWYSPCSLEEGKLEKAEEPVSLFKKRRVGINSQKLDENCKFVQFANYAGEIEDFELSDKDATGVQDKLWQIECLSYIQNWKILKKLTITSVNIHSGKFIIDIIKNCTSLSCLKIHDDKVQDNLSLFLCEGLKYASNLKDFRILGLGIAYTYKYKRHCMPVIKRLTLLGRCFWKVQYLTRRQSFWYERKGSIPVDTLFESLTKCSKLERLFVQSRSASKITKKPLETLVTKCDNIIFLFIFIAEIHETACKSMKQAIYELGVKPQQIIIIKGQNYDLKNIMYEDIPTCHVEEIICQESDTHEDYLKRFFNY